MSVERLLMDLNAARLQLMKHIEETTVAVDEHHLAWQQLTKECPHDQADGVADRQRQRREIDLGRRREAYYLGQAVALTWALRQVDATLQRHGAQTAGRVFSCPLPPPRDELLAERPTTGRLESAGHAGPGQSLDLQGRM